MKLKTFFAILISATLLTCAMAYFTGCAGPERTALNTTKVVVNTVDTAMKAFVDYEKQYGIDAPTRLKVKALYAEYVKHGLAVETSWLAFKQAQDSADPNVTALQKVWEETKAVLAASESELIFVIEEILNRKK